MPLSRLSGIRHRSCGWLSRAEGTKGTKGTDDAVDGVRQAMLDGETGHQRRVGDPGRRAEVDLADGCVPDHLDDPRRGVEVLGPRLEPGPLGTLDGGVARVDRRPERLERPVGRDELGRRLLADARDSRQPIARVTPEDGHVRVGRAVRDAVLVEEERLVDDVRVAHAAARRVEDADVVGVVHELEEVAVPGDDVDREPAPVQRHEGADDVVGLVPVDADPGDAERSECVDDDRHLHGQGVRHLLLHDPVDRAGDAVGLVRRDRLDAEGGPPVVVPAGREMGRARALDERGDHVEQAPDGVGRDAARADDLWDAEEGPEVERGGVKEQQLRGCRRHVTRLRARVVHDGAGTEARRRS